MKVKKKITKKKLKQPDEFISFTEQAYRYINQHFKQIAGGVILVLVLLAAFFLFRSWEQKKEEESNKQFFAVLEKYQRASYTDREANPGQYQKILDGFEEVIKNYPRTASAHLSLIYKGGIYLQLAEFDEAIKAYENFFKKGRKERFYQLLALEGLGYAYEGKKDYEKALVSYQKMMTLGVPYEWTGVHLNLARCYEKMGKNEEALEHYRAFLKSAPNSFSVNPILRKTSYLEK